MAKVRHVTYIDGELEKQIKRYSQAHSDRFKSASEASEHLLKQALEIDANEHYEDLLLPKIQKAVRQTVRDEVSNIVSEGIQKQSNRLAALLIKSGRYSAAGLEQLIEFRSLATHDSKPIEEQFGEAVYRAGRFYRPDNHKEERQNGKPEANQLVNEYSLNRK